MSDKTKRVSIDVSVNTDDATKALKDFSNQLTKMSKKSIDFNLTINKGKYTQELNHVSSSVTKMVNDINKNLSNVRMNISTANAERNLNRFTANLTGVYGKIEKGSRRSSQSINRAFGGSFNEISKSSVTMASQVSKNIDLILMGMEKSFVNSFQGINNKVREVVKSLNNSLKNINFGDASKQGAKFVQSFAKGIKSSMHVVRSAVTTMGKTLNSITTTAMRVGKNAGSILANSIIKGFPKVSKGLNNSIKDALKNDYTVKLKEKGLTGKVLNAGISAQMPKELAAVTKKYTAIFLETAEDINNTTKVIIQGFEFLKDHSNELANTFEKVGGKVSVAFDEFIDSMKKSSNANIELAGRTTEAAKNLTKYIGATFNELKTNIQPALGIARGVGNVGMSAVSSVAKIETARSKERAREWVEANKPIYDAVDKFEKGASKLADNMGKWSDSAVEKVQKGEPIFSGNTVKTNLSNSLDGITDIIEKEKEPFRKRLSERLKSMADSAKNAAKGLGKIANTPIGNGAIQYALGTAAPVIGPEAFLAYNGYRMYKKHKDKKQGKEGITPETDSKIDSLDNSIDQFKETIEEGTKKIDNVIPFQKPNSGKQSSTPIDYLKGFSDNLSALEHPIKAIGGSVISSIGNGFKTAAAACLLMVENVKLLKPAIEKMKPAFEKIGEGFTKIKGAAKKAKEAGVFIGTLMVDGITSAMKPVKAATTFITGIVSKVSKFVSVGAKIGKAILKGISGALNIVGSTFRVFFNVGKAIASAIAKGITGSIRLVSNAIKKLANGIMAPIKFLGNTIGKAISSSISLAKLSIRGMGGLISDALSSDGPVEIQFTPVGSNNLFGSLFNKNEVTNQLKRDLSLITATMPRELGKVTQLFGARLIDAGEKARQYAKVMLQAYDFVKDNKEVIVSTFKKLYDVVAPVLKDVFTNVGTILKVTASQMITDLLQTLSTKLSGIEGPLKTVVEAITNTISGLKNVFAQLLDPASNLRKSLSNITTVIDGAVSLLSGIFEALVNITNVLIKVVMTLKDVIVNVSKVIVKVLSTVVNTLKAFVKGVATAKDMFVSGIKKSIDVLLSGFRKVIDGIKGLIGGRNKKGEEDNSPNNKKELRAMKTALKKEFDEQQKIKQGFTDINNESDKAFDDIIRDTEISINKFEDLEVSIDNVKYSLQGMDKSLGAVSSESFDKIKKDSEDTRSTFEKIKNNTDFKRAAEGLKQTASNAKTLSKNLIDSKLAAQKVDNAFNSLRHPIQALRTNMQAKLGKFDIKLKVQGEKEAIKAATNVANAMNKFKTAKGSEKLTAGLDVAIQSIKYKLITLKNTLKENFVSNLINKMSPKAKKASKELAENIPGGNKTIGFFKGALGKLALLMGGIGIGAYIKQATDLAIKYEASAMQIQRSLGSASQKIVDFANNSAAAFGISQTQAMQYGNTFSLMVRQFETDTNKIADTTNALMQAAAITASATGTELETVMDGFRSALSGSVESVDQYGICMRIANIEAKNGISNWNELTTSQQQFYITQELINQATANFGGTTLKNTNSMLAQFKAQLSNTSLALGKAFKALLTVVLPYLTAFLKVLEKVFNYISTMITSLLSLFGITVDFTTNAGSGIESVGGDIDTSGLDGVSDGMDNVAEGADGAKESIEKMKGSLAG